MHPALRYAAPAIAVLALTGCSKKGDLVLFEAMGGGFTWGAALARM